MKKILVMSVALSSFSAFADWNLKNENESHDLMAIVKKGQYSSETIYETYTLGDLVRTVGGSKDYTYKHELSTLKENINYGVIDNLEIGLGIGYQLSGKESYAYGPFSSFNGKNVTLKESGIINPSLNSHYRLFSQAEKFSNVDLLISYTPKIGTSKNATASISGNNITTNIGNAIDPNSNLSLGINFGKKYTNMAWRIGVREQLYSSGKSEDVNDSTSTINHSSYSDLLVDGSWQWTFSNKYILNLNAGFGNMGEKIENYSSGTKVTWDKKSYSVSGLDFKYILQKNVLLSLGFSSKSYNTFNWNDTSLTSPTRTEASNISENILNFSVKTEF